MRVHGFHLPKVQIITLGCAKNIVDSEQVGGNIQQTGQYHVSYDNSLQEEYIDITIINTCGFIDKAKAESINTILQYIEKKQQGQVGKIYVMGCLSERYREELQRNLPEVDAFLGTFDQARILQLLQTDYKHELTGERFLSTARHYAYLKISEGCNRTCSFCAIPIMRGKHRSKPIEKLLQEAVILAHKGVKEIILIAQELTYYGLDLYKKRVIAQLVEQIAQRLPNTWIRLHYAYPQNFPIDLIKVMTKYPNICPYLDMPLQHASDKILQRMRRGITRSQTEQLLDKVRSIYPGITLRTTFLVGFPGETEQDIKILIDFIQRQQLDRVGVFTYSNEEGTQAYDSYKRQLSTPEKERRATMVIQSQRKISLEKNRAKIGTIQQVLIDYKESGKYIGRTMADSPEVDNEVIIDSKGQDLEIGNFLKVKIIQASDYELLATI